MPNRSCPFSPPAANFRGQEERRPIVRALGPPLTIALALVTTVALLLIAAAINPPPLSGAVASPPARAAIADTLLLDAGIVTLARSASVKLPPAPAVVDLARLTYEPGASGPSHALPGPLFLAVESGSLTVDLAGAGQVRRAGQTTMTAGEFTLRAGDSLVLPTATPASFHNGGAMPVVALAAGIFPAAAVQSGQGRSGPTRWVDDWSPGAAVQPMAGGWLVDPPPGPAFVELSRVSLRPGGDAPLRTPGPVVLAVETGALRMTEVAGLGWRQPADGPDTLIAPATATTLLPGDAALLQDEATATLRNDGSGPLLVLDLTVDPGEPVHSTGAGQGGSPETAPSQ
jgi:quercetin dioxygenase-like cupin family protein